eukprot:TRINITY_DN14151_c0_g1_i1.p1 TRINITY_DN14151_c0_g1~~TRINITY_DN14151_c0_g1_i1.p1  ORF type:complete len:927 (+),score=232.72 TRINITY_DN14151_c0_g1_i1:156-2936(+)
MQTIAREELAGSTDDAAAAEATQMACDSNGDSEMVPVAVPTAARPMPPCGDLPAQVQQDDAATAVKAELSRETGLQAFLEEAGLKSEATKVIDITGAESIDDLAILTENDIVQVIEEAGLRLAPARKLRNAIATAGCKQEVMLKQPNTPMTQAAYGSRTPLQAVQMLAQPVTPSASSAARYPGTPQALLGCATPSLLGCATPSASAAAMGVGAAAPTTPGIMPLVFPCPAPAGCAPAIHGTPVLPVPDRSHSQALPQPPTAGLAPAPSTPGLRLLAGHGSEALPQTQGVAAAAAAAAAPGTPWPRSAPVGYGSKARRLWKAGALQQAEEEDNDPQTPERGHKAKLAQAPETPAKRQKTKEEPIEDCGVCKFCKDKRKNGGAYTLRKACIEKQKLKAAAAVKSEQHPAAKEEVSEQGKQCGKKPEGPGQKERGGGKRARSRSCARPTRPQEAATPKSTGAKMHSEQTSPAADQSKRQRPGSQPARTKNYYKVLHLAPNANQAQVRKNYLGLARQCHPDKVPGSEAAADFIMLHEAYSTLYDSDKRAAYDSKFSQAGRSPDEDDGVEDFSELPAASPPENILWTLLWVAPAVWKVFLPQLSDATLRALLVEAKKGPTCKPVSKPKALLDTLTEEVLQGSADCGKEILSNVIGAEARKGASRDALLNHMAEALKAFVKRCEEEGGKTESAFCGLMKRVLFKMRLASCYRQLGATEILEHLKAKEMVAFAEEAEPEPQPPPPPKIRGVRRFGYRFGRGSVRTTVSAGDICFSVKSCTGSAEQAEETMQKAELLREQWRHRIRHHKEDAAAAFLNAWNETVAKEAPPLPLELSTDTRRLCSKAKETGYTVCPSVALRWHREARALRGKCCVGDGECCRMTKHCDLTQEQATKFKEKVDMEARCKQLLEMLRAELDRRHEKNAMLALEAAFF